MTPVHLLSLENFRTMVEAMATDDAQYGVVEMEVLRERKNKAVADLRGIQYSFMLSGPLMKALTENKSGKSAAAKRDKLVEWAYNASQDIEERIEALETEFATTFLNSVTK